MEGTIGEIRMFAGTFAPLNWALCAGQQLDIAGNSALFAVIGNIYGGDGNVYFQLPDLRSRIPVGAGQGPGLSTVQLGSKFGEEYVTLNTQEMPIHNHTAAYTPSSISGVSNPLALNGKGAQVSDPTGAFMADAPAGTEIYSTSHNVKMGPSPVTVNEDTPGSITLLQNGGSSGHINIQPSLGVYYIICVEGIYPSRN